MAVVCTCSQEDLSHWDILRPLNEPDRWNLKCFCVFRAHGGTGAILITDKDEVYGLCSDCGDMSLFGVTPEDGLDGTDLSSHFRINALSGKFIKTVSIGVIIGAALDSHGQLYWWGKNSDDQMVAQPPQLANSHLDPSISFIEICCGHSFMAALTKDGKVYVWGRLICSEFVCEELSVDLPVTSLSCGAVHVAMLTSDGSVFTWGSGFDGQRGYHSFTERDTYTVRKLELDEPCISLVCGPVSTVMLLISGELWACGGNTEDLCFLGVDSKVKKVKKPARVNLDKKVIHISLAWLSPKPYAVYVAVTDDQEIYTWGPHYPPKSLPLSCKLIDAFYNTSTPRDKGLIYLSHSDLTDPNLSTSIEVISMSTTCTSRGGLDLLNPQGVSVKPSVDSTENTKPSLFETSNNMCAYSAELFGTSKLSDITFIFDETDFPGHRLFLCSRSRRFREILDLNIPAHDRPVMDCRTYNPVAFKGLLQHLYTGHHAVVELSDLLELLSLAVSFSEGLLAEAAANQITYLLEPDNVLTVVSRAKAIPSPYLMRKCESYITYLAAAKPDLMTKMFLAMADKAGLE